MMFHACHLQSVFLLMKLYPFYLNFLQLSIFIFNFIFLIKKKFFIRFTQIGVKRIHLVRTRGGNVKHRALRLDHGNFSWASERNEFFLYIKLWTKNYIIYFFQLDCTRKTRIVDVVYNSSNNELVRTKTLVKNCIVLIDATPFRTWYEGHYAMMMGRKKGVKLVSFLFQKIFIFQNMRCQ